MPDVRPLLTPLEGPSPCGPNLEYDPDFLSLDILAAPRDERGVGGAVRHAEEPEWRDVARRAAELAGRTRDLRLGMHLCAAWLKVEGCAAWTDALALLRGWLERYWDHVHPLTDGDDPTERANVLSALCSHTGMLAYLRHAPLVQLERVGSVTLRDLRIVSGTLNAPEGESVEAVAEHVEAVLGQTGAEALRELDATAALALSHIDGIAAVFAQRTPGMGPDLDPLRRELREWRLALKARLPEPTTMPEAGDEASAVQVAPAPALSGDIRGPDDVRRQLDTICRWYERHEPSSPVAALLRRARSLVGMDFEHLLALLAPGGLAEFRHLAGTADDEG